MEIRTEPNLLNLKAYGESILEEARQTPAQLIPAECRMDYFTAAGIDENFKLEDCINAVCRQRFPSRTIGVTKDAGDLSLFYIGALHLFNAVTPRYMTANPEINIPPENIRYALINHFRDSLCKDDDGPPRGKTAPNVVTDAETRMIFDPDARTLDLPGARPELTQPIGWAGVLAVMAYAATSALENTYVLISVPLRFHPAPQEPGA